MFACVRSWVPTGLPSARQTGPLSIAVKLSLTFHTYSILNYFAGLGQSLCAILWRKQLWAKPNKSRLQSTVILSENLRWACWIQSGLVNESASLDFDLFPLNITLGLPAARPADPARPAGAEALVSTPVLHEGDWLIWDAATNANTATHIAGLIGVW